MCGRHGIVLSAIGISVACLSLHQLVATRRKASREIESIFKKSVWCSQSPFKPMPPVELICSLPRRQRSLHSSLCWACY